MKHESILRMFDQNQLVTLATVVRLGSLEAAAGALHVTPSAVSQRIKALESAAGQVLVRRIRPARPTWAGAVLVRLAGQIELLDHAARAELGAAGPTTLAIAVNADSLSTWFPQVLTDLPGGVLVDLHRVDQDRTADLLRDGSVVAAVTADRSPVQGCSSAPLGSMRYLAMATEAFVAEHRLSGGSAEHWAVAPMVAFDRDDTLQDRFLADLGVQPPARHQVPSQDAFLTVLRAGLGWGMVPEIAVRHPEGGPGAGSAEGLVDAAPGRWLDVPLYWQRWKVQASVLDDLSMRVRDVAGAALRTSPVEGGSR
jgi:LysR family transcriptional regulator, chromosome initiation inhibitor